MTVLSKTGEVSFEGLGGRSPIQYCFLQFGAVVFLGVLFFSGSRAGWAAPSQQIELPSNAFSIDDYFSTTQFRELVIASDGKIIAYAVDSIDLKTNKTDPAVYLQSTTRGSLPELIEEIQDGRKFAWIPNQNRLAFLSDRSGTTQLYSYDVQKKTLWLRTNSSSPIVDFQFAPNGNGVVYFTQPTVVGETLYERFRGTEHGIIVDSDTIGAYDFLDPNWGEWPRDPVARESEMWIDIAGSGPRKANIPGSPQYASWSPDGGRLSVTYVAHPRVVSKGVAIGVETSVGIYDVASNGFAPFAEMHMLSESGTRVSFAGDEWIPGTQKILIRRYTERGDFLDRFFPQVVALDLSSEVDINENSLNWVTIEPYGVGNRPMLIPCDDERKFINIVFEGRRSLFRVSKSGDIKRAELLGGRSGSQSLFDFSDGVAQATFVEQSLTEPPEIYIWRQGEGIYRLTSFNENIRSKILPNAREVFWKSKDKTKIHGWLLEPSFPRFASRTLPMVTFVHGGPQYVMPDEFAHYFNLWPYPFEVLAQNGIRVFIPNYRGSRTYGRKFVSPDRVDGEPVDDIISGIDYLVHIGVADPDRLAISGQSHGAWLGPLVMSRARVFAAGSFSEGTGNATLLYDLTPGLLNRDLHSRTYGGSLYKNPQRYVELSPELHFEDLDAAVLFEAGAYASAVPMLGYPKAARHAGMPSEYIVYPKTGHGMTIPRLRRESAERNLDWFRFWLKDEEDPDPSKAEQYNRWRTMRDERCTSEKFTSHPSYCPQ
tara:strand:+ start:13353 stop:15653 length:2301 start_codon:yes stop_codon:yes gene_type:complete